MSLEARTPPDVDGILALSEDACAGLREACARVGYTEAILERTKIVPRGVQGAAIPLLRRALLQGGNETYAAGVLALLFACQDDVGEAAVREVLGDWLTDALLDAGFLRLRLRLRLSHAGRETSVCSNVHFVPLDGLWLIGDHVANGASAVMPPGPTTGQLVRVMPERVAGRVLDIGCGPGSLALVAARRGAMTAIGTDINPRAIHMAQFNARFNGISNASFLVGDLTEPVHGERFELVVAQPPFVIQPPDTTPILFVHGGPTGEAITHRVVAALPDVLVPEGRALILAETANRPSEPLHQRFRQDLANAPIDLVLLTLPGSSPDLQALQYATLEAPEGGPEYTAAIARYARHLDTLDIRSLTQVLLVARARDPEARTAGHRFVATVPVKHLDLGDGAAIDVLMASLDLASADDATLAVTKLRASPFAHWIEDRTAPDIEQPPTRAVRFDPGRFATDVENLSDSAFHLAGLIDAADTVADAAREHADANGLEWEQALAQTLRFAREALGRGLIEIGVEAAGLREP